MKLVSSLATCATFRLNYVVSKPIIYLSTTKNNRKAKTPAVSHSNDIKYGKLVFSPSALKYGRAEYKSHPSLLKLFHATCPTHVHPGVVNCVSTNYNNHAGRTQMYICQKQQSTHMYRERERERERERGRERESKAMPFRILTCFLYGNVRETSTLLSPSRC